MSIGRDTTGQPKEPKPSHTELMSNPYKANNDRISGMQNYLYLPLVLIH